MDSVKKKLDQASKTIDRAGVRTRAIGRKLRDVEELPKAEVELLLVDGSERPTEEDKEAFV